MIRRRYRSAPLLIGFVAWGPVVLGLLSACSSSPNDVEPTGAAFPNRRAEFSANGRALGYVVNQLSDSVSVLDLDTLSVLGTVAVGNDPVEIDGPRNLAVDRDRGLLYLLLTYPKSIPSPHVVANGIPSRLGIVQQLSLTDLAPRGVFYVDPRAFDLAMSRDRELLAVSHFDENLGLNLELEDRRANLALISPAEAIASGMAQGRSVKKVCAVPAEVAIGNDGTRAYVACTGEDALAVIDTRAASLVTRVPAGEGAVNKPYSLVMAPDGTRVFLGNQLTQQVVAFPTNDSPTPLFSTTDLGGVPYGLGFIANEELVVAMQFPSSAALLDARTGVVRARVDYADSECQNPTAVRTTARGRVFMVCESDHYTPGSIVEVNPATLAVLGSVKVGLFPDQMAIVDP